MTNLQFVRIEARLSHGLSYLSPKIRLLDWNYYPMTCLPSPVNVEFLVKLNMLHSKLEELWEGIKVSNYVYCFPFYLESMIFFFCRVVIIIF